MSQVRVGATARDRRLYSWAALGAAVVVLLGFARTYYLKTAFGTPELPLLRHLHGAVMTSWFLLFITQTQLVARHRIELHRRLGAVGACLGLLILVLGTTVAIDAARRGSSPGPPPLVFMVIPLADMAVFALLLGTALWFRDRKEIHRRLMLLVTLSLLPAAIARIPIEIIHSNAVVAAFGLADLFILLCVGYDTYRNRRLHPAFGWGAALVIASHPFRLMLSGTALWTWFASWLVGQPTPG